MWCTEGHWRIGDTGNVNQVAIKTVQGDECSKEEVQKFLDEVMRMKSFAHPHVLSIIGICIMENQPYAVLPYMDNGDLKGYLQNKTQVHRPI